MAGVFVDSLYDAVLDCLKVLPVLFLAYLLVSYLSHDHSHKFGKFLSKSRKTSVFYASFLGCVPQCGFSSVIADFYSRGKVSLGTLVAVFIATSDEAIPIMLTNKNSILYMLLLIAIKIVLALIWGFAIDGFVALILRLRKNKQQKNISDEALNEKSVLIEKSEKEICHDHEHEAEEHEAVEGHICHHSHEHHHICGHIHTDDCDEACGHEQSCCVNNVFLDAYYHTFEIVIYIFVATFVLNLLIGYAEFAGVNIIEKILTNSMYIQVLVAALVGLIPNCASSVLLVELYVAGSLAFPALVAGLTSCAGVGVIILWTKNRKKPLQNLGILLMQFLIGIASGMLLTLFF